MDDPQATKMLAEIMQAGPLADNASISEYVAKAVYSHAVKLHFDNADANQLLTQLAGSSNPQFRKVGETALQEMQAYRVRNGR